MEEYEATLLAGIPAEQPTLYHRLQFSVGDPAGLIEFHSQRASKAQLQRLFIVRDIEVQRARSAVDAEQIAAPGEFAPERGLSADRATATAQAIAEALRRHHVRRVRVDRSLPYLFAHHVREAGIELVYDPELGVRERRAKSVQEIEFLTEVQGLTEQAMAMACAMVARADAIRDGTLRFKGEALTSERVKAAIAGFLLEHEGTALHGSIVATTPHSGDCHHSGSGPLRTGQPVIIDIFPRHQRTRYHGDCTRTVVHGQPTEEVQRMHAAVVEAKAAATALVVPGNTGQAVHQAALAVLTRHGFATSRGQVTEEPTVQHGTGHGIGLEVHEPILLDDGAPALVEGEAVTVEPGLYGTRSGGVRVEDMVIATSSGPRNLNRLHEGLAW